MATCANNVHSEAVHIGAIAHREDRHAVAAPARPIDLIDIFRPANDVDEIVDQAIARHVKGIDSPALWLQLRIVNLPAAERAAAAGLTVIMDKCVKMEHGRYGGGLHKAG